VFKGISGILSAKGTFAGTLERIEVHGDTVTPEFTLTDVGHAIPLRAKYDAIVDGTNGDTFLERIDGSWRKTSLVAKGSVADAPGVQGRQVDLDVTMDQARIEDVLWAFRDRILDLKKDRRFRYILIFKNQGEAAGASLEHSHCQLIALPIVPKRVREEVDGSKQYYTLKERCIYCDIIRQELDSQTRVVDQNDDFAILEPYAPRFPFETWILPKVHESSFEEGQSHSYENLAKILKVLLTRMDKVLVSPAYNLVIHTSPFMEPSNDYYHWHFEMMPRLTRVAGFEWGTGFYINPTPPEEAAQFLRDA